jgi:hypothetical protein
MKEKELLCIISGHQAHHILQSTKWSPETRVAVTAEVDESAGIPLDFKPPLRPLSFFPSTWPKTIFNDVSKSIGSFSDGIYTHNSRFRSCQLAIKALTEPL